MAAPSPNLTLLTGDRRAVEHHLADEVRAQRERDPLAPLPIVVGGTLMRPHLRRHLAELTGAHLNLRIMTVGELGLQLGHRRLVLAGRKPLPFLADRILAHQVALESSGYFEPVAAMPGFPAILLRTLRELRTAGISSAAFVEATAQEPDLTGKLTALAALYADHERRRAGFFSSEDGLAVADPQALGADRLLLYGVWDPSKLLLSALETLAAEIPVTVLLPQAQGDAAAAVQPFITWAHERGVTPRELRRSTEREATKPTVRLVSAPDPTREVQEVVRACVRCRWASAPGLAALSRSVELTGRRLGPRPDRGRPSWGVRDGSCIRALPFRCAN